MKMIKKLSFLGLMLFASGSLRAMENAEEPLQAVENAKKPIKITLEDGSERTVEPGVYELWQTVGNWFEDMEGIDTENPVPLPNITPAQFEFIEEQVMPILLEASKDVPERLQAHLYENLTNSQDEQAALAEIIAFICASNYLDSELMLHAGINALAQYLAQPERMISLISYPTYQEQIKAYLLESSKDQGLPPELWEKLLEAVLKISKAYDWILQPHVKNTLASIGTSAAWSPNGQFLAASSLGDVINIWDMTQPHAVLRHTLEGHTHIVFTLAWSPDGNSVASGSLDAAVVIWDMTQPIPTQQSRLEEYGQAVCSVAWSPNGNFLAVGSGNIIDIWDMRQPIPAHKHGLGGYEGGVWRVAWSPNGNFLAVGSGNIIDIWDMTPPNPTELHTLEGHVGTVLAVAWSPNGNSLASGSDDNTIKIWNMTQPRPVLQDSLEKHTYLVRSVAWSPDGNFLASGSNDKTIKIWDMRTTDKLAGLQNLSFEQACLIVAAYQAQQRNQALELDYALQPNLVVASKGLSNSIKTVLGITVKGLTKTIESTLDHIAVLEDTAFALEGANKPMACCIQ